MDHNLQGKRLLLVEDDELVASTLEEMLRYANAYSVALAHDVKSALEALERQSFDAGILDVNLRNEFSWPVAGKMRELGVPYVCVSGYGTSLDHPLAGSVLPKPYSMGQLLDAVTALLP